MMLAPPHHRARRASHSFRDENASAVQRSGKNLEDSNNARSFGTQLSSNTPHAKSTPAGKSHSHKRRALGDISNRKPGLSSSSRKPTNVKTTPSQHRASFVVPKSTSLVVPKKNSTSSGSIAPSKTPLAAKRQVSFALPKPAPSTKKPAATVSTSSTPKIFVDPTNSSSTVEDVELPAGRLWCQEPDSDDDEDDVGIVTEVRQFQQQWMAMQRQEIAEGMQRKFQEHQKKNDKLTEQINAMLDNVQDIDNVYPLLSDNEEEEEDCISLTLGLDDDDDGYAFFPTNDISF